MRGFPSGIRIGICVGICVWATTLLGAPYAVTHRSQHQAQHRAVFVVAALVFVGGGVICHQQPSRSFHVWNTQVPVCARCTGLYASLPLGVLLTLAFGRRRDVKDGPTDRRVRVLVMLAATPTVLTVAGELLGVAQPPNLVRAAAAIPLGVTLGWLVAVSTREPLRRCRMVDIPCRATGC